MSTNNETISYHSLLKFFLPLAATPLMIGLTHSIINAALARLPFPEESIAVFTVVKSFVSIISAPSLMSLQLVVTYVNDRKSFNLLCKFVWSVGGLSFTILFLLGYTPLGELVLKHLIGLTKPEQIRLAYIALRIVCFLPLVQVLRNTYQGIALRLRKTHFFVPGIILRLLSISIFLWYSVHTQLMSGIAAGSLSWMVGIGIEGLFIFLSLKYFFKNINRALAEIPTQEQPELKLAEIFKFFVPLGLMISLGSFIQPIIQGGIARTALATQSLAAYGVAWSLIGILSGPTFSLHQISLVFTDGPEDDNWKTVLHFSLLTGFIITVIILFISFTPMGFWLLHNIIGVSVPVANMAQQVLIPLSIFPLIRGFREPYWGLLMTRKTTSLIGVAKAINITVVFTTVIYGILKLSIAPAVFGALAFNLGELVESIFIWYYAIKHPERKQLKESLSA